MTSSRWPCPRWIAHRGGGTLAPENTLAAFRVGAAHGYRAYECDVKLSRDGLPFLLHDATLERTTSGQGRAADQDWAALSRLDAGRWMAPAWAGEPPPSLDAIVAHCLALGHRLNVEIKPTPGDEVRTGEVVAAALERLWRPGEVPPLLSSFQTQALEGARAAAPALPRALLIDTAWDGWLDAARGLGCVAVVANHRLLDAPRVAALREAGLGVLAYTVNETDDAQRLLALGVDGLITDRIDRFAPALDA
ncbi:glycerophosphodiester phosphodiesterase [Piscinibacter sakaiensis]|uniref:Glycerophosphoryl diester phosphodiesterase n=1 Tax=Piscinibacter sakaiensis TaxID=1547922 RepID=A0A0K8NY56_PISS1|nr:glycerophosphodiester phosphodiesterase [Piscinibacter sakaiensis]GAP35316.1 glycerophosphoryl diester phosphodiesterase [Piscinibacter sakaiensis]